MAKPWICGLVVSQNGAEMPGAGWDGERGIRQAVHPASPKLQPLDVSQGAQGGGLTPKVAHYPGLSPEQHPLSSPVAPSSAGSAPLLRTQSPRAGEMPALSPCGAAGARQCLRIAAAAGEPSSTRDGEEALPSPGGAPGLGLCMAAARAVCLPSCRARQHDAGPTSKPFAF